MVLGLDWVGSGWIGSGFGLEFGAGEIGREARGAGREAGMGGVGSDLVGLGWIGSEFGSEETRGSGSRTGTKGLRYLGSVRA